MISTKRSQTRLLWVAFSLCACAKKQPGNILQTNPSVKWGFLLLFKPRTFTFFPSHGHIMMKQKCQPSVSLSNKLVQRFAIRILKLCCDKLKDKQRVVIFVTPSFDCITVRRWKEVRCPRLQYLVSFYRASSCLYRKSIQRRHGGGCFMQSHCI